MSFPITPARIRFPTPTGSGRETAGQRANVNTELFHGHVEYFVHPADGSPSPGIGGLDSAAGTAETAGGPGAGLRVRALGRPAAPRRRAPALSEAPRGHQEAGVRDHPVIRADRQAVDVPA